MTGMKNQKSGKENREKSKAATGNRERIIRAFAKISPTSLHPELTRRAHDYCLKWAIKKTLSGYKPSRAFPLFSCLLILPHSALR
jgi:hypothetical protein